jgi:hypothetical protein
MNWPKAIEINRDALTGIVAGLVALLGGYLLLAIAFFFLPVAG